MRLLLALAALPGLLACTGPARAPAAAPVVTAASTSGGLRVELEVEGTDARSVLIRFRVRDDDGGGPGHRVHFGDGTTDEVTLPQAACAGPLPVQPAPYVARPVDTTVERRHVYAEPGSYAVQVRVVSQRPCAGIADEEVGLQQQVEVR